MTGRDDSEKIVPGAGPDGADPTAAALPGYVDAARLERALDELLSISDQIAAASVAETGAMDPLADEIWAYASIMRKVLKDR